MFCHFRCCNKKHTKFLKFIHKMKTELKPLKPTGCYYPRMKRCWELVEAFLNQIGNRKHYPHHTYTKWSLCACLVGSLFHNKWCWCKSELFLLRWHFELIFDTRRIKKNDKLKMTYLIFESFLSLKLYMHIKTLKFIICIILSMFYIIQSEDSINKS